MTPTTPPAISGDGTPVGAVPPMLQYPGGKRKIAPCIVKHIQRQVGETFTYVDTCVGAGGLLHAIRGAFPADPQTGWPFTYVADASPFVDYWWDSLKFCYPPDVVEALERDYPRVVDKATYYEKREEFRELTAGGPDGIPPAAPSYMVALMYWLNRVGFNGLVRYNREGVYNVPAGKRGAKVSLPTVEHIAAARALAQRTKFYYDGIEALRASYEGGGQGHTSVVVTVDPPYLGGFDQYAPGGWSPGHLRELLRAAKSRVQEGSPLNMALVFEHTGGLAQEIIEGMGGELTFTWGRPKTITCKAAERSGTVVEGVWAIAKQGGAQ